MPRTEPSVNLNFCESHVILKAVLPNGDTLRLGSANLEFVPEDGSEDLHAYQAKITKDSEVKITTTSEANQVSVEALNVDKELGLTLNDVSSTLVGSKIVCSKVFAPVQNARKPTELDNLAVWYAANRLNLHPNAQVTSWTDLSGNSRHAVPTGVAPTWTYGQVNGLPTVSFTSSEDLAIPGSFKMKQLFVVFRSVTTTFPDWAFIGSSPAMFEFAPSTTHMKPTYPRAVRLDGTSVSSPFDLGTLTEWHFVNIKTNSPDSVRSYIINRFGATTRANVDIAEIIGFSEDLSDEDEQYIEAYLAGKYGKILPYTPFRTWERKVLLTGEITSVNIDENTASIGIISDIAPNVAFISARPIQTHCPLIFKGTACGYVGPLATCNKIYESQDGCAGRNRQFRFAGIVIKGELTTVIPGGIDTVIGGGTDDRLGPDVKYPDGPSFPILGSGVIHPKLT